MLNQRNARLEDAIRRTSYANIARTRQHMQNALAEAVYLDVRVTNAPPGMFGVATGQPIIALEGTIETIFNRVSYATPIGIYLPPTYPVLPPTAILRPTSDMIIIPSMNVNNNGMISLPYLTEWNPGSSSIVELIGFLASIFSQQPPLRKAPSSSIPSNNSSTPQLYTMNSNYPMNTNNGYGGMMNPGTMYGNHPNPNSNPLNYSTIGSAGPTMLPPVPNRLTTPMVLVSSNSSSSNGSINMNTNNYPVGVPSTTGTIPNNNTNRNPIPPPTQIVRMNSETAVEDSFREELTRRLREELRKKFTEMRDNIDNWNEARDKLLQRETALKNSIGALKERISALQKYKTETQETIRSSQQWLDTWDPKPYIGTSGNISNSNHTNSKDNEDDVQSVRSGSSFGAQSNPGGGGRSVVSGSNGGIRNKYSNTTVNNNNNNNSYSSSSATNSSTGLYFPNGMRLNDFIIPSTVLQTQLLDAIAEDTAIEDLYTWVGTAADEGRLPPDALVKEIRDLARRQFRARYIARKIDTVLTEEVRQRLNLQVQYGTNPGQGGNNYSNVSNNSLPVTYPSNNNGRNGSSSGSININNNGYPPPGSWNGYPSTK